ncbi:cation/H(+) antiporter 28 [Vicia villosa]|uniref:cation/H(+) antiporter 28 n=1 Tax=Vicia villosa TaxID=3911 RepID=UPI00273AA12F|nr:cation/H(+) antiporter 28 [Vicia villosa]
MAIALTQCSEKLGYLIFLLGKNFVMFMAMVIACNGVHFLLKPYQQPRITSDILVGLLMGNVPFLRDLYGKFNHTFGFIIDFGMMCYMFALGVEMDPYVLFKKPIREAQVAYAGVLITFVIAGSAAPLLHYFASEKYILEFTLSLSTLLASTASPVLTRLITSLNIGKSDIGKLVIAAGMYSDFICSLLLSIGYISMPLDTFCTHADQKGRLKKAIVMNSAVLGQALFTATVSPVFMKWVDNENPEGKPMKGSHLVLSIAFMVISCASSILYNYSPVLSAFITGICFPREGRVSKWVISKINYLLTTIFFPIFFLWMGNAADFRQFQIRDTWIWVKLFGPILIVTVGKVAGTVVSGIMLGFHWPESVAIGLLLTTKGHFHIYMAIKVMSCGSDATSGIALVIAIFFTVVHAPAVVAHIIKRAKKKLPMHRMSLQLLDPSSELRILLCLHGPENISASINFMEISRGKSDPGILVYVTEMIELNDQIAVTVERGEGVETTNVKDKDIVQMRDQITSSFQGYLNDDGGGVTLKRTIAVSTINNMAQDICTLAEELMIALIILPFHRSQTSDGKLDGGNQGFRYVNRKLLKSAPCSVGILVNRGLGSFEKISKTQVSLNVATVFIGGKDDREALAYAGRVAGHPGVKLTVIRFLVDTSVESSRMAAYRVSLSEKVEEMGLDDECFAQFYDKYISSGKISYIEKHLANAAETFSTLRSFEGQYSLVIVGREGGLNSILTKGMNDWQQCPELGPIGDVLSGPDFSTTVSVLVIQQHKHKGEIDGLDEEFNIM